HGGGGDDEIHGGNGNDELNGQSGADILVGGHGNDSLSGSGGNDILSSNDGNDLLSGGDGDDLLLAGSGLDTSSGDSGTDLLFANPNVDEDNLVLLRLLLIEWLAGASLDERISAALNIITNSTDDTAADSLTGGEDGDWFLVGPSDQLLDFDGATDQVGAI
ncbi:MAG: Ca2+-binding RTX toxin-like protein, partial [Mariniblastus sp.]